LSSGGCHRGVVIWFGHLVLSSGVVIWCCHLGCHLVLSSEMTHSRFYLFIENFIHSPYGLFYDFFLYLLQKGQFYEKIYYILHAVAARDL
jgi:hypothetical protein